MIPKVKKHNNTCQLLSTYFIVNIVLKHAKDNASSSNMHMSNCWQLITCLQKNLKKNVFFIYIYVSHLFFVV